MRTCWAAVLGDCRHGWSKEHVFSKGLIEGRTVQVRGLPRCAGEYKEIGDFTAGVLCRHHNSALAHLDEEAIRMKEAFKSFCRPMPPVTEGKGFWPGPEHYEVDGERFARWLVKTHHNMLALDDKSTWEPWTRYVFEAPGGEPPWVYARDPRGSDWVRDHGHQQYREYWYETADSQRSIGYFSFYGSEWLVATEPLDERWWDAFSQLVGGESPELFDHSKWVHRPSGFNRGQRMADGSGVRTRELTFGGWRESNVDPVG